MKMKTPLMMLTAASLALFSCQKDNVLVEDGNPFTQSSKLPTALQADRAFDIIKADNPYQGQYIVTMEDGTFNNASLLSLSYEAKVAVAIGQLEVILNAAGLVDVEPTNIYLNVMNGFAAALTPEQVEILEGLSIVSDVEAVQEVSVNGTFQQMDASAAAADEVPYGIARVGGARDGSGKRAWVIDTGIDSDHEDLNVNRDLSKGFVGGPTGCGLFGSLFGCNNQGEPSFEDGQGHGTHVAGTIAALDNNRGVIGVAAGAEVVAVKVLGDNGSGSTSGVIQGVDYVAEAARPGEVANLSLGGGSSSALDRAVVRLGARGVFVALAAGNESQNANNVSPARANGENVFTVSAMDAQDRFASYSNFANPPIDFAQPGSNVRSTYRNNRYATLSGTSMAAPHLAGVLLITNGRPAQDGKVKNDPDGNADPIAVLR